MFLEGRWRINIYLPYLFTKRKEMVIIMKNNKLAGTWFCGNEASDYAKEKGYLDYATLAKAFDAVLNNNIMQLTSEIGYWDQTNGMIDNSDEIEELEEQIDETETKMYEYDEDSSEYKAFEKEINEMRERIEELENEENDSEIFQYYIISDAGAQILEEYTDEIVFYNEELDMYVWGVTHWGTAWSYVLTDIKLNCGDEAYR